MKEPKSTISPNDIFRGVIIELNKRGQSEFKYDMIEWHKAFYSASKKFDNIEPKFEISKKTNPYVHDVEKGFRMLYLNGYLSLRESVNEYKYRINDPEHLKDHNKLLLKRQSEQLEQIANYICDNIK